MRKNKLITTCKYEI